MSYVDLILKKRNGQALDEEEIKEFVSGVKEGTMADYQITALLMAIYFQGLNRKELANLTSAMAQSGASLSFPDLPGPIVDKHSSGGVGDKTSLVVGPIVAACGLPVAKLSGRGLGFTGGTIDKLSAIPGFRTALSEQEFVQAVQKVGLSIASQSKQIAPVDQVLYALRDVSGTVDSLPLIASSIMSKKLVDGSDALVLDVKVGSGAFMKTDERAIALAQIMVEIGLDNGKKTLALISDMDQPLGRAVGNALEVKEAIETLQGRGPEDVKCLCLQVAAAMLELGGKCENSDQALAMAEESLRQGRAYQKLLSMVAQQGGEVRYVEDPSLFAEAEVVQVVRAPQSGFIGAIQTEEIGRVAQLLGAGRSRKEDTIDPRVGLMMDRKLGDAVEAGEALCHLYARNQEEAEAAMERALQAFSIVDAPVLRRQGPVFYRVSEAGVEQLWKQ